MKRYKSLEADTGVTGYETGRDYIRVRFKNRAIYRYTYASTGANKIEEMKRVIDSRRLRGFDVAAACGSDPARKLAGGLLRTRHVNRAARILGESVGARVLHDADNRAPAARVVRLAETHPLPFPSGHQRARLPERCRTAIREPAPLRAAPETRF